jgi:hypothetical protein
MDVITEIGNILSWYKSKGQTATIDNLLRAKDKLAVNSWYLAEQAADMKSEYNMSYFQRKINIGRAKQEMTSKGMPVNRAEIDSLIQNEGLFKSEILKEAAAYRMDLLVGQTNMVIRAIEQRVSYLKREKEQVNA